MTVRKALVALVTAAAIAAPVSAQARDREDEELFALGAAAGAAAIVLIGGLVTSVRARQPVAVEPLAYTPVRVSADAHTSYCANRYRSYDAATDTFQPYNGPRRACVSPYTR